MGTARVVKIGSPDEVFWRYLELKRRLSAPASRQSLIAERGLVFGDKCRSCKGDTFHEERSEKSPAIRYVCSNDECGKAWPVDLAFLLRNEFQNTRRTDGVGDLFALMATYSQILNCLPLREQRIYLLLYLYEGLGGYDQVAVEATRRWPRSVPPWGGRGQRPTAWSAWGVRRAVTDARRRINEELRMRGIKGAA